jgi:ABC-type branched-subunit amino acid transport system ATPase component
MWPSTMSRVPSQPGTLTSIVGPNGAGKTTYFNLISGQLPASEGTVLLNGEDITRLPAPLRTRRGLGRAFQLTQLFPNLSVHENVRLAIQAREAAAAGAGHVARVVDRKAWIDEAATARARCGWATRPARPPAACRTATSASWKWRC